jgi:toxin secretion/phage lysis holin
MGICLEILAEDTFWTAFVNPAKAEKLLEIAKGFYDRALISKKMSQGMISKAMIFVVLIVANMLDVALSGGLPVAKTAVITFYIALEGLSILENLGQMNVPLPAFIKDMLLVLQDNGGEGK